jgi:hypothetical protein
MIFFLKWFDYAQKGKKLNILSLPFSPKYIQKLSIIGASDHEWIHCRKINIYTVWSGFFLRLEAFFRAECLPSAFSLTLIHRKLLFHCKFFPE